MEPGRSCHMSRDVRKTEGINTQFKTTMKEGGYSDMIATVSVLQLNGSIKQVMVSTQGS